MIDVLSSSSCYMRQDCGVTCAGSALSSNAASSPDFFGRRRRLATPILRDLRMFCASAADTGLYTCARSFAWACLCSSSHTGFLYNVWLLPHLASSLDPESPFLIMQHHALGQGQSCMLEMQADGVRGQGTCSKRPPADRPQTLCNRSAPAADAQQSPRAATSPTI